MDFVSFLASINKISIVAFSLTVIFLAYEIRLLRKEHQKSGKPTIPQFQENIHVSPQSKNVVMTQSKKKVLKHNNIFIVALVVLLILFGGGAVVGFLNFNGSNSSSQKSPSSSNAPVNFISSQGVKLFTQNFTPLSDQNAFNLRPGDTVIIGVETVDQADIDSARIRVNKLEWSPENITTNFNAKNKLYYITYTIATAESQLKIEAQLHSKTDGWLGE